MGVADFLPSAPLQTLKKRAQVLREVRAFFYERDILEVDVPVFSEYSVTDCHVEALQTSLRGQTLYLQTSPEYYLKRLLAAGAPSLFYLGPAFRNDEHGRFHRPEFKMLEWYRIGFNEQQLVAEVLQLLERLAKLFAVDLSVNLCTYGELFERVLGLCPYRAKCEQLEVLAREKTGFYSSLPDKSAWLDLLFSHCVEPAMGAGATVVTQYPLEQSALARCGVNEKNQTIAHRFEVFWNGIELANGYWELRDMPEQRRRFESDQRQRKDRGLAVPEIDLKFLAALDHGLPDCSGVALGLDRLLLCLLDETDIAKVMPFAHY